MVYHSRFWDCYVRQMLQIPGYTLTERLKLVMDITIIIHTV